MQKIKNPALSGPGFWGCLVELRLLRLFLHFPGRQHIHIRQIRSQVGPLVFAQNAHGQTNQGPQVHRIIATFKVLAQIMNLRMAIVARCDAVLGAGGHDLVEFYFAECAALFGQSILQKAPAAAAAIVIGAVGGHVDKVFLAHNGFDHIAQIFGDRVPQGFANQLARILAGKFDLALFVPFGTDLQLAFPDPFGIKGNDTFDCEIVLDVELLQSDPDRVQFVPSLGIEPDLAAQIIDGFGFNAHDFFPVFKVGHKHAIVFSSPPLGAVGPIRASQVQNFP